MKRLFVLASVAFLLSGCLVPQNFSMVVTVKADRSYSFEYSGKLNDCNYLAAQQQKKALSADDKKQADQIDQQLLATPGFTSVQALGPGQFQAKFSHRGKVGDDIFYFMAANWNIISFSYGKNGNLIVHQGSLDLKSAGSNVDIKFQYVPDGQLTVKYDANALNLTGLPTGAAASNGSFLYNFNEKITGGFDLTLSKK